MKVEMIENRHCLQCSQEDYKALRQTLRLLDELFDLSKELNFNLHEDFSTVYDYLDDLCWALNDETLDAFDFFRLFYKARERNLIN